MWTTTLAQMRRVAPQFSVDHYEILTAVRAVDSYGRETLTYSVLRTVRAQLATLNGSEQRIVDTLADSGDTRTVSAKLHMPFITVVHEGNYARRVGTALVWDVVAVLGSETLGSQLTVLITRKATADE